MRRSATLVVGVALLAAGCGGSSPRSELAKTAENVGKIRAGTISFALVVHPRTKLAKSPFGFKLHGPFSFGDRPTAHVAYTQIANGHEATAALVLGRDGGYALTDGKRRELTAQQLATLRGAAASARSGTSVDVSKWVTSARRCGNGCVTGSLDVAEAVTTLLQYTGGNATLTDAERRRLADGTRATYRALMTKDDLLRDLRIHARIALPAPGRLRTALGRLVGADVEFRLAIANAKT